MPQPARTAQQNKRAAGSARLDRLWSRRKNGHGRTAVRAAFLTSKPPAASSCAPTCCGARATHAILRGIGQSASLSRDWPPNAASSADVTGGCFPRKKRPRPRRQPCELHTGPPHLPRQHVALPAALLVRRRLLPEHDERVPGLPPPPEGLVGRVQHRPRAVPAAHPEQDLERGRAREAGVSETAAPGARRHTITSARRDGREKENEAAHLPSVPAPRLHLEERQLLPREDVIRRLPDENVVVPR